MTLFWLQDRPASSESAELLDTEAEAETEPLFETETETQTTEPLFETETETMSLDHTESQLSVATLDADGAADTAQEDGAAPTAPVVPEDSGVGGLFDEGERGSAPLHPLYSLASFHVCLHHVQLAQRRNATRTGAVLPLSLSAAAAL
jgi:hypothetical protein